MLNFYAQWSSLENDSQLKFFIYIFIFGIDLYLLELFLLQQ